MPPEWKGEKVFFAIPFTNLAKTIRIREGSFCSGATARPAFQARTRRAEDTRLAPHERGVLSLQVLAQVRSLLSGVVSLATGESSIFRYFEAITEIHDRRTF